LQAILRQELAHGTREEIERVEAQRQNLMRRLEMVTVTLTEEFKAELQTAPVGTLLQLWNGVADGWDRSRARCWRLSSSRVMA
jgi:hypothetical protein